MQKQYRYSDKMNLVRHETRRELNDTLDDSTAGRAAMMITMMRSKGTLRTKLKKVKSTCGLLEPKVYVSLACRRAASGAFL